MDDNRVTVDALKELWLEIKERLIQEHDITNDITPIFWKGIKDKLEKRERINIVIRGQETKGKSTAGCYIKYRINKIIQKFIADSTYNPEMEYDLISANQIEYMRVARRQDLYQVTTLVDEFSDLAKTGLNASTEESLLEWYSKVCAQKYLHTIFCTPKLDYDRYGLIILSVLDVDKSTGITKLKVYYNDPAEYHKTFLGYLTINVTEILNTEWYSKYKKKKQFVMDLLLQESIKDVRELEFSLVTLIGYHRCKQMAELGEVDGNMIALKLDRIIRESKSVYSILGKTDVQSKIKGLLTPILLIRQKKIELYKNRRVPLTVIQQVELEKQIKIFQEESQELLDIEHDLLKLYIKYSEYGHKNAVQEIRTLLEKNNITTEV